MLSFAIDSESMPSELIIITGFPLITLRNFIDFVAKSVKKKCNKNITNSGTMP